MPDSVTIRFGVDGISAAIAQIKQLGSAISGIVKGFTGPLATIGSIGGIAELAHQFQEFNIQVNKAMQMTGLAANEMAGMAYAAGRNEVSIESLQMGLKAFSKWLVETGQDSHDITGKLLEQADLFQRLGDGADRNALAVQRFGRAGLDLIPLLDKGRAGIEELIERGELLGGVNEHTVKTARDFQNATYDAEKSAMGFAGAISQTVEPSLTNFFNNLAAGFPVMRAIGQELGLLHNQTFPPIPHPHATNQSAGGSPGKVWTPENLEASNKQIDAQRQQIALTREQQELNAKGLEANKNFAANLDSIEKDAELVQQKRNNAAAALAQKAISKLEYDQMDLGFQKELLALDVQRQNVVQTDIAVEGKKTQLELEGLERQRTLLQNDFSKTQAEKRSGDIALLKRESDLLKAQIDALQVLRSEDAKDTNPQLQGVYGAAQEEATKQKQGVDLKLNEKQGTPDPASFQQSWQKVLTEVQDESALTWQKIATSFKDTLDTAVNSVSTNFTKLIEGTETWRKALVDIGETIETTVINSIIKMFLQWITSQAMAALAGLATSSAAAVTASATWATPATLATISSYGGAAAAAPAEVLGAVGTTMSMTFADGGYTGAGGKYDVAGVVHAGEYVMPADTVQRLGLPYMESIHRSGGGSPSSTGTKLAGGDTHVHLWGLEDAMNQHLRNNSDAENHVMRIVKKNAHKVFPRQA